jgi:hypothetical protein
MAVELLAGRHVSLAVILAIGGQDVPSSGDTLGFSGWLLRNQRTL